MPIEFNCPSCNAGLSVKEEFAGKNANCPQCSKPFTVPSASAPNPAASNPLAGLNINIGDKPAAGGNVKIDTGGAGSPTAGGTPGLSPAASPQPGAAPHPGAAPQTGGAYASPGMDYQSDAARNSEPPRRSYPALTLAVTIYTILSFLILIVGAFAVLGALAYGIMTIGGIAGVFMSLGLSAVVVLYTFIMWISLKTAAEFIKLAMNIEHDTHRIAENSRSR